MAEGGINISTIHKFDGNNFQQWKFQVRCALRAKGVFEIASGTTQKPTAEQDAKIISEWDKKDAVGMCIITSSMELSQITLIEACETSKEILDKLDGIYAAKSETNKMLVHEEFHRYKMDTNDSMIQHITKIENLARQIRESGDLVSEIAIITKIIGTLPGKYSNFRQAWMSLAEDRQTIKNLTSRLVDEERNLTTIEKEESALTASAQKKSFSKSNIKKFNKTRFTCYNCNKKGHFARDCRLPRKNSQKDNQRKSENNYSAFSVENDKKIITDIKDEEGWILDSGASAHMTSQKYLFNTLEEIKEFLVKLGNGDELPVKGIGTIQIKCWINDEWIDSVLTNVWYIPGLKKNLFSEGAITSKGMKVIKENQKAEIYEKGSLKASAIRGSNNLYKLLLKPVCPEANMTVSETLKTWHLRLGHVNLKTIREMITNGVISGVKLTDNDNFVCEGCLYGKQHKLPHLKSTPRKTAPGEFIHSDICGPMSTPSISGCNYFVLFKDDCTGYRSVYFLKHKADTLSCFKEFQRQCQNKFGFSIKALRTDNGTEYINKNFKQFLKNKGIQLETSAPYSHEQNGKAEREIRTIVESARSMLYTKDLPLSLWAEAVNTATYILNRTTNVHTPNSTPFEKWTNRKPVLSHLKVFGCKAFMHVPDNFRSKLDPKSVKLVLVGYENESTNYRLFDPNTKKIKVSRNVTFDETSDNVVHTNTKLISIMLPNMEPEFPQEEEKLAQDETNETEENQREELEEFQQEEKSTQDEIDKNLEEKGSQVNKYDFRTRGNLRKPARYEANLIESEVPNSYQEAINSEDKEHWKRAINEELESLENNKVWELVPLTEKQKTIDGRWIFKIKRSPNGEITRYKARLVAKGFAQVEGIDFNETYAPTTRYDTIRILLAITVKRNYNMIQFDVKTAFLHGDLEETIYMRPPPGVTSNLDVVCKLKKSLYGLRQSARCWNTKFNNFLQSYGLKQCESDKCVYKGEVNGEIVLLVLYVDDGLIITKTKQTFNEIIAIMKREFEITVSEPNYFVGMEIKIDKEYNSISIHVSNFIERMLKRFNLLDAKTNNIPADPHTVLISGTEDETIKNIPYREAVGSLMFAAITARPDIMYAVNLVSRFQNNPNESHWNAVKRILKYLKLTKNFGICYSKSNEPLIGYCDADYASDLDTRRSTTGYVFKFSSGPITWCSRRQKSVSLSTTEAEFVAASEAAKEAMWLKQLFNEIGEKLQNDLYLCIDNQSAIKLIKNPILHKRTKHIDIRYNFVREKYENNDINVTYVTTNQQLADVFTKALPSSKFNVITTSLGMVNVKLPRI